VSVADGWKAQGKCQYLPVSYADKLFFPDGQRADAYKPAKAFCETCPVRLTCSTYAIVYRINWGAWGGMSPTDRRRFARGRRQQIVSAWKKMYPTSLSHVA
jgi:WhiB family redox-sensing transcriptional regulator